MQLDPRGPLQEEVEAPKEQIAEEDGKDHPKVLGRKVRQILRGGSQVKLSSCRGQELVDYFKEVERGGAGPDPRISSEVVVIGVLGGLALWDRKTGTLLENCTQREVTLHPVESDE